FPLGELPAASTSGVALPDAVRRAARRVRASDVILIPVQAGGAALGSLELFRAGREFDEGETAAAGVAAGQPGLGLRAFGLGNGPSASRSADWLALAGDALGAGPRGPDEVVRIAARASGAEGARLWKVADDGDLDLLVSTGSKEAVEGIRPEKP